MKEKLTEEQLMNKKIRKKFPEFTFYFEQWDLSKRFSFLKHTGKQAVIKVLNLLNDNHLSVIQDHFSSVIAVEKIDNNTIVNLEGTIDNLEFELNKIVDGTQLTIYRKDNQIYISSWR